MNSIAFHALIIFHIFLICSSLSLTCHGEMYRISRKMVLSSSSSSFPTGKTQSKFINGGAIEEAKKAVESSLREAPTSVSNPTQN
ncbi:hypothetical protein J1N35_024129 [Gossypium stocksii]|uniref:Uncharacterized protein n=1 Tax=Gossypium stocksii TaxID=47602 RepID=A0A9D4A3T7_9ROSI|nr:hypothetical protein J1N35_024129 [Gossypium stocksii]